MRYILSLSLIFLFAFQSISQEKHFILIQSETKQLFNVTINGKVYSTNASGYAIIPKLQNGEYTMVLAFPENTFPDQAFKFVIDQKDLGFNLQNMGEKGWILSNLQTQGLTMAEKEVPQQTAVAKTKADTGDEPISFNKVKDTVAVVKAIDKPVVKENEPVAKVAEVIAPAMDSSSISMATIVSQKGETKDSAIFNKPVLENTTVNAETKDSAIAIQPVPNNIAPVIVAKDTAILTETPVVSQPTLSMETTPPAAKEPDIKKLAENRNEEGITIAFSDSNDKEVDTINVYIKSATQQNTEVKDTIAKSATDSIVAAKIEQLNNRKDDVKFIEIDMDKKSIDSGKVVVDTTATVVKHDTRETDKVVEPNPVKTITKGTVKANVETVETVVNNRPVAEKKSVTLCKSIASDIEYIKLRRKMALEDSDDRMIREARKVFKETCFTSNQMRGLSTLFLSDEGRYHFFSAAYSFVSDPEQYSTLQSEFIDPYFINRFKSIIHQ